MNPAAKKVRQPARARKTAAGQGTMCVEREAIRTLIKHP